MLHKFFEPGHWFAAKKRGYGSGFPTAWQGWVLIAGYIGVVSGLSLLLERSDVAGFTLWAIGIVVATSAFLIIARNRTPGRWR